MSLLLLPLVLALAAAPLAILLIVGADRVPVQLVGALSAAFTVGVLLFLHSRGGEP